MRQRRRQQQIHPLPVITSTAIGIRRQQAKDQQVLAMLLIQVFAYVENVNDPNFRCYNGAGGNAPNTYSVEAGKQITFHADSDLYHIGVLNVYMAKAPGKAIDFDGAGQVWFKIYEITAHADPTGKNVPTYPATALTSVTFTIPKNVPTGEYLVRIEHIALHNAQQHGGAQFYIACAQIAVTNGGNGTPGPLVSIPGVYTGHEPGIIFNPYWPIPTSYTQPGPAVWSG
ncbi:unnamed protein product [Adineta steineri]|uniref:lytic cellulose monooxygenase (C4-dehydrogenating) n=1 Tax=Adineta steineri TaxID=433720 RepID=A0A814EBZ7_9BILA|nr:unnamed protein product [Adineta steineri]CAF4136179.1 unnamed protein product [Adineta steineri]